MPPQNSAAPTLPAPGAPPRPPLTAPAMPSMAPLLAPPTPPTQQPARSAFVAPAAQLLSPRLAPAPTLAAAAAEGTTGPKAMGSVIKAVREQAGPSADGAKIAAMVKAALT